MGDSKHILRMEKRKIYFPSDLFAILFFTHHVNTLEKQHLLNKNIHSKCF